MANEQASADHPLTTAERDRAAGIMLRMGFLPSDTGPYVTEFRRHINAQVKQGLVSRSAGTWAHDPATIPAEERARAFLAMEWAIKQGHTSRVELLDGDINSFARLRMAVCDWLRRMRMKLRVLWTKRVLRRQNPFRDRDPA